MSYWKRLIEWCQEPSKIKIRWFNPRNVVVLLTFSILVASSISFGAWQYSISQVPQYTFINPESLNTLTITTDTTLTEDYYGYIIIATDGITLDGNGYMIIGQSPDIYIDDPQAKWGMTTGILLEGRTGVTIKNCTVTGFATGIHLYESNENIIQANTANNNAWTGFALSSSSNNLIQNNIANNNGEGEGTGFALGRSFENTLQANTAKDNESGITLEEADGNIFFHNSIINNTFQVIGFPGYANIWDDGYPSGGNYWSDYAGIDTNGDGLGDTAYVIEEDNIDNFPLMTPTSVFDDGT